MGEGLDLVGGGDGWVGRALVRVVPAGVDAVVEAALDVGGEAVADNQGLLLDRVPHGVEGGVEDAGIGFGDADLAGDDDGLEIVLDGGYGEAGVLDFGDAVTDEQQFVVLVHALQEFKCAVDEICRIAEIGKVGSAECSGIGVDVYGAEETAETLAAQCFLADLALLEVGPDLGVDLAVGICVVNGIGDATVLEGGGERFALGPIVVE